jgi:hypothetical protein
MTDHETSEVEVNRSRRLDISVRKPDIERDTWGRGVTRILPPSPPPPYCTPYFQAKTWTF